MPQLPVASSVDEALVFRVLTGSIWLKIFSSIWLKISTANDVLDEYNGSPGSACGVRFPVGQSACRFR